MSNDSGPVISENFRRGSYRANRSASDIAKQIIGIGLLIGGGRLVEPHIDDAMSYMWKSVPSFSVTGPVAMVQKDTCSANTNYGTLQGRVMAGADGSTPHVEWIVPVNGQRQLLTLEGHMNTIVKSAKLPNARDENTYLSQVVGAGQVCMARYFGGRK